METPSGVYMDESGQQPKNMATQAIAHVIETPLREKSDEVLISLFQGGEKGAYRYLVDRYQRRVRNLLYSIFNEPDLIDDIAQEVFIKAYEALPNFRFQSSFYTWLYRIAVNKCRDELRRRKVRRILSLHALPESVEKEIGSKMVVHPVDSEMQHLISSALQTLPEKFRVPIVLKEIEGFSYEEIADIMQCEIGTVKSRLFRARAMLRKTLKPLLEEQ
ncbi:MAG: sigma-70 family RNA polymerase sigma factor [bacterium]